MGIAPRPAAGRAQRRRPARQQVRLRLARLAGPRPSWPRRTGRDDFAKAAAKIAAILGERAADRRIETLQDRIHRLYAWWLIDKTKHANKIKRETGALISLFRTPTAAGTRSTPGPARARSTRPASSSGRCLRIGLPRDHPAVAKALRYLLAQQQDFGGWFQTTTHENFRTPMRETRYAVMALAEAFPRRARARARGWGNRDEGRRACPARTRWSTRSTISKTSGTCPRPDRRSIRPGDRAAARTSRADGAGVGRGLPGPAGPGRVGRAARRAGSPIRPRSSGARRPGPCGGSATRDWASNAIAAALEDANPRVRRGAARIFAYQFHGHG